MSAQSHSTERGSRADPGDTSRRLANTLGREPVAFRRIVRGFANNERWLVRLKDGGSVFAKCAVDAQTAGWLHHERRVYEQVGAPFMPRFLAWDDDGQFPILVLEDLTDAFWPPPWTTPRIDAVREALAAVHETAPPSGLPSLEEHEELRSGWLEVAADPEPFLGLGLCSRRWLADALPTLIDASQALQLGGSALVHLDVRSDNLCLRDGRCLLIDWNSASVGNPIMDLAAWLPTLEGEGGPAPDAFLGDEAAGSAAGVSGYWAARAGLPPPATAPHVRPLQQRCLRSAFAWTVRTLDLPPPR